MVRHFSSPPIQGATLITLTSLLLVLSLIALLSGSIGWSFIALMTAVLLLSPIVFLVLFLVGAVARLFTKSH